MLIIIKKICLILCKRRYNGHIYLTALAAVEALASAMGDTATGATAAKALALGQKKLMEPIREGGALWDSEKKYWHAHSETSTQIFTDTLYGQMLAHHHLQNFTLPVTMLQQHLQYEWARNQDKFGMRVLRDPVQEDSIWMSGPPTISYINLAITSATATPSAAEFVTAIEPFYRMSENFRSRLRDQWNLRALTHTDGSVAPAETERPLELGAPREQGHYGFMLTDLFLLPLISGQVVDMPHGKLSFTPMYSPPFTLPMLISNCEGTITATTAGNYTLAVNFGSLKLPAEGLAVNGVRYKKAVQLTEGQSISWSA
jgi:hypothetical protein